MKSYKIPLRFWFLAAPAVAVPPAAILACPVGLCLLIAALLFSSVCPSPVSSTFNTAISAPGTFLERTLLDPFLPPDFYAERCGGAVFIPALFFMGFPYAWFFCMILLSLLGFSRWNREKENNSP